MAGSEVSRPTNPVRDSAEAAGEAHGASRAWRPGVESLRLVRVMHNDGSGDPDVRETARTGLRVVPQPSGCRGGTRQRNDVPSNKRRGGD